MLSLVVFLLVSLGGEAALVVHDKPARFKQFFRVPENASSKVHWTLKVDTQVFGVDFITFFAADIDRPLEYACAHSNALCNFTIIKGSHNPEKHQTKVYAHLSQPLHLAVPTMSGRLMVCTAQIDMFWKRPLIVEGAVHPYWKVPKTTSGNYFCQFVSPKTSNMAFKVPPNDTKGDCPSEAYSCSTAFYIQPDIQSFDLPELDLHIWYMTRENYRDMRAGKLTNVVIPLFQGREYSVHIYGTVSKPYAPECHVTLPTGASVPVKVTDMVLNRLKHAIPASPVNAGMYAVNCSVVYTDGIEGNSHNLVLQKAINITFIKGPRITLEAEEGYVKYFPANTTTVDISVMVYTTSPLVSFKVDGMARHKSAKMFTSFVSSSPYEIVWKHGIQLAKLTDEMNGVYRIRVVNKDKERASQDFVIHKANALSLIVSPVEFAVQVGSPVRMECAAIGNLIEDMKMARDVEHTTVHMPKEDNLNVTDVKHGTADSRGLRLTIAMATLKDSGFYHCTASNRYESITKTIKLIVWPIGGSYLSPNATNSSLSPVPFGPTVLDISEREIRQEHFKPPSPNAPGLGKHLVPKKHGVDKVLVGGISAAAGVVVVIIIVTAIVVGVEKKRKKGRTRAERRVQTSIIGAEWRNRVTPQKKRPATRRRTTPKAEGKNLGEQGKRTEKDQKSGGGT